jgi:hypothetical protein
MAKRLLGPMVRDNHTPSDASMALRAEVDRASLIALQKRGDDRRRFDHFVPF